MLPQGEVVTANFDFDRIAQGGKAHEFDGGADEQTHFHETRTAGGGDFDFCDDSGCAKSDRSERLNGHELKS